MKNSIWDERERTKNGRAKRDMSLIFVNKTLLVQKDKNWERGGKTKDGDDQYYLDILKTNMGIGRRKRTRRSSVKSKSENSFRKI